LWRVRYGEDPGVIGRTITINGVPHSVIGILPAGEAFPNSADVWTPISLESPPGGVLQWFGRLSPGVTAAQASTELRTLLGSDRARVERFTGGFGDSEFRLLLYTMQGTVAFVLLIACANAANLLLARAVWRTRDTSIRVALGAGRWRIVRQLLAESLLLSVLGGILGLALSEAGVRTFARAIDVPGTPYWWDFSLDYRSYLFLAAVSVATGVLFGLAPAIRVSRANLSDPLREAARGASAGVQSRRLAGALLVGELALTVALLAGAGLMIRSFTNTQQGNLGIDSEGIWTAQVRLPEDRYADHDARSAFRLRLLDTLNRAAAFQGVTAASFVPGNGARIGTAQEHPETATASMPPFRTSQLSIAPGYFSAVGLQMVAGREFDSTDGQPGSEAVIVNDVFARSFWSGQNPVGKRLRLGTNPNAPWATVVGVSPFVHQPPAGAGIDFDAAVPAAVYTPLRQKMPVPQGLPIDYTPPDELEFHLILRTPMAAAQIDDILRTTLALLDPDLPLHDLRPLDEVLRQRGYVHGVFGSVFAVFAVLALVMSAAGLYGVTAYGVGQRTQEIGIRMTLGATRRDVLRLVLRQAFVRITVGISIGLVLALALTRILGSALPGVTAVDPVLFGAIIFVLASVAILACLIPARRAMQLDPSDALRTE
jgi:predicted permease